MRVEGNSRLPKICCHNSGRFVPLMVGVGVATATVGSSGGFTCAGDGDGAAEGLAAGVDAVGVGAAAVTGIDAAGAGVDWGVLGAVDMAGDIGSAKSPSKSTSSQRRGCTL